MNNNFEFSDWANNTAYIIDTTTGKVVDTVAIHEDDNKLYTYSGKPLSYYGLIY